MSRELGELVRHRRSRLQFCFSLALPLVNSLLPCQFLMAYVSKPEVYSGLRPVQSPAGGANSRPWSHYKCRAVAAIKAMIYPQTALAKVAFLECRTTRKCSHKTSLTDAAFYHLTI